jgi:hypothetical protein
MSQNLSADEKLTAFVELERAIHGFAVSLVLYWPPKNMPVDEKLTAFLGTTGRDSSSI